VTSPIDDVATRRLRVIFSRAQNFVAGAAFERSSVQAGGRRMDKPTGTRGSAWIAALAIAFATAYALHESYEELAHIDGVSIPEHMR
jgi:hypothetical protein